MRERWTYSRPDGIRIIKYRDMMVLEELMNKENERVEEVTVVEGKWS